MLVPQEAGTVLFAPGWQTAAAIASGGLVGLSMGLTGGGGAILAVPLLVYLIGVPPKVAVVISLLTVAVTAAVGALERWLRGEVELPTGLLFAGAGMLTAPVGNRIAHLLPEPLLLLSFALLTLIIAIRMWRHAGTPAGGATAVDRCGPQGPSCARDPEGRLRLTSRCAGILTLAGLTVGLLSGLYGVGGGFLIVPALVTFAAMDVTRAVGTSLLVMMLVGASGVGSHFVGGSPLPLGLAGLFAAGSIPGLFVGSMVARTLPRPILAKIFAGVIVIVAVFVIARTLAGL
jgi:uncharacterized membrane protein YfcA